MLALEETPHDILPVSLYPIVPEAADYRPGPGRNHPDVWGGLATGRGVKSAARDPLTSVILRARGHLLLKLLGSIEQLSYGGSTDISAPAMTDKAPSLVIYGATGFVGSAILAALRARNNPYLGFGSRAAVRWEPGATCHTEDCAPSDRLALLSTLSPPKAVIFVAGRGTTTGDFESLQNEHLEILRGAITSIPPQWHPKPRFLYASSALVYGRRSPGALALKECDPALPSSDYGKIKLQSEELLSNWAKQTGTVAVSARLFNLAGIGQKNGIVVDVARQAADIQSGARTAFRLRSNRPILDISDVGEAAEALLLLAEIEAPPQVLNICSGRPLTTADLIRAARDHIGRNAEVSYENNEAPSEALVGDPKLICELTGWRAHKSIKAIIGEMISQTQVAGA